MQENIHLINKNLVSLNIKNGWKKIKSEKENLYIFKSDGRPLDTLGTKKKYKKKYLSWSILPKKNLEAMDRKCCINF